MVAGSRYPTLIISNEQVSGDDEKKNIIIKHQPNGTTISIEKIHV